MTLFNKVDKMYILYVYIYVYVCVGACMSVCMECIFILYVPAFVLSASCVAFGLLCVLALK